ncbi:MULTISPECIES: outer membrane beta-barrel protein [unclassified Myroides]|uniref:outer membrane beta-barrel protein n=1 Tax=unclassified Myroides TaxID=2642485 RepID=UPI0015F8530A|nr:MULTISPECIES: outer membrane beta-barrel protein [unclassified Myroides]MBB1150455.1 outer membrane beta-barrel protein [Myroides sp. NP-2]MDM1407420.1 outer membrane beta-barrel protein [Myroides sp. DF42-4-2]
MKKYIGILTLGLLVGGYQQVQAQYSRHYFNQHEVAVSVKAGMLQNYGSLPSQISSDLKFNTAIGLQYDYYLSRQWSLGIGAQYAMYTTDFTGSNLTGQSEEIDSDNQKFIFSYDGKTFKEQWKVNQVNIPLTVQYVGEAETAIYVRTGVQFSLMMSSKPTVTWNNLQTSGYFPAYNLLLDEALLYAGFGFQEKVEHKPDLELKDRWAWIAEVGVKHNISENQNLYVGLYFDLGLNNQKPSINENKEHILVYKPELNNALEYNSIQESSKAVFKNYSFGIQLRYAIGL